MKLGGIKQNVEQEELWREIIGVQAACYCYCYADLVMIQHWFGPHSFFHHFIIDVSIVLTLALTKKLFESKILPERFDILRSVVNKRETNEYISSTCGGVAKHAIPVEETEEENEKNGEQVTSYFILILPDLTYWLTNLLSFLSLLKSDNEYF